MKNRKEIFHEITRLIEEQVETLKGKVTSDQAIKYARRRERLQELVVTLDTEVATEQ